MAAILGNIETFHSKVEDWLQYEQRLEQFFIANGIETMEKKRAVLITVVGRPTFKVLRSLIHPKKPEETPYSELTAALKKHFMPPPSEIVQRFKFHTRFRRPTETVAEYVSELRALSEYCNFGDSLEEMLRDRLVCGIANETIQSKLLAEKKLTYLDALALAQRLESAIQNI